MSPLQPRYMRCHCGSLYTIYLHTVKDQSECPDCRAAKREEYEEQQRRRGRKPEAEK